MRFGPFFLMALLACAGVADAGGIDQAPANPTTATGGTTFRTLQDRFGQWVNVKDYGAKCDGSTDDYAAVNTAASAASSGNVKAIYFPPSATVCLLSQSVTIPNGVTVFANPGTVTLKPTSGNTSAPVLLSLGSNVTVYGMTIDGGGQDFGTANNVVQVFSQSNTVIDTVTFQHTRGVAFLASTSVVNVGVRNSTFTDVGNHWKTTQLTADRKQAVAYCCGTAANNHGNFVTGSYFTDIGLDAVSATAQSNFLVSNNRFDLGDGQITATWIDPQPTAFGAAIYGSGGNLQFTATDNTILGAPGNAIDVAAGSSVVTGNFVSGSGQAGIGLFSSDSTSLTTIVGNVVQNNAQWASSVFKGGISLSGTYGAVTVAGNVSTDTQGSKTQLYGFQVVSGSVIGELRVDPSNSFAGNATAAFGGIQNAYSFGGTRDNRFLNPCFALDQINEGGTYAAGGGNRLISDGYTAVQSQNAFTEARSTATTFPGCGANSLHIILTGSQTAGATDAYNINQQIPGVDLKDLAWGTSGALPVVLDWCVKTSVAGTYSVVVTNQSGPRSYAHNYTVSANTVTCPSLVIPGDTAGALGTSTAYALMVVWDFGSGSTRQTSTLDAWAAGNPLTTTTAAPFIGATNGATFDLSAVRLYAGQADVPWIPRSQAEELEKAQYYYRKTFPPGTAVAQSAGVAGARCTPGVNTTAGTISGYIAADPPMRISPVVTTYNPSAANANWRDVTGATDVVVSVDQSTAKSQTGVQIGSATTAIVVGNNHCIHATLNAR